MDTRADISKKLSKKRKSIVCERKKARELQEKRDKAAERQRLYRLKHAEEISKYNIDYNARNKNARAAQWIAYKAIKSGELIPRPCENCGAMAVVAHHDDYNHPMQINWLCTSHHKLWHSEHGPGKNNC